MKQGLSFRQYRAMDIAMFTLMFIVFEFIIVKVATGTTFRDQAFTVSLAAAITTLTYMRWGMWGGFHAVLFGVLFSFFHGGTWNQYLIYGLGNLFSFPAGLVLKKVGHERIRNGTWLSMLFPLGVILSMQLGRALVSLVLGASFAGALGFFTTDSLSVLFTLVIIWICRRLDGIYEEQHHYLKRVREEEAAQ